MRGRPLISRVVAAAEAVTPGRVVVVLGAHRLCLRSVLARHHRSTAVIGNPDWREGMASSLRVGIDVLPARARAVLLLLTDQPDVDVASLRRLIHAWRRHPSRAAAAAYEGKLGAPAILPRPMWARARGLPGDVGARALLRGAGAGTTNVALPEAAFDVDTEEDRARLASRYSDAL